MCVSDFIPGEITISIWIITVILYMFKVKCRSGFEVSQKVDIIN